MNFVALYEVDHTKTDVTIGLSNAAAADDETRECLRFNPLIHSTPERTT